MSFRVRVLSANGGGIENVQHHVVLLNQVFSTTIAIVSVDPGRTLIDDSFISDKDISVLVTFNSSTEILVQQSDKKAVTTVRIQLIELK